MTGQKNKASDTQPREARIKSEGYCQRVMTECKSHCRKAGNDNGDDKKMNFTCNSRISSVNLLTGRCLISSNNASTFLRLAPAPMLVVRPRIGLSPANSRASGLIFPRDGASPACPGSRRLAVESVMGLIIGEMSGVPLAFVGDVGGLWTFVDGAGPGPGVLPRLLAPLSLEVEATDLRAGCSSSSRSPNKSSSGIVSTSKIASYKSSEPVPTMASRSGIFLILL